MNEILIKATGEKIMFKNRISKMPIRQFTSSSLKGDLFKYQSQLPKLPVPSLPETTAKYLRSVEPFLSKDQFSETSKRVEEFARPGGVGETLQNRLVEFAKDKDNWLSEWWDDYAYMSYRDPVVPYVSYFFSHKNLNNEIGKDQLLKATLIAQYTIEFMQTVQNETLEPEIIKGNPFCMNAFKYMFNTSRVPEKNTDITKLYDGSQHPYFVVIYKNNFFKVDFQKDGQFLSASDIYNQLQEIKNSPILEGEPVGSLTSMNRDEWYNAYQNLTKSPINQASLETIFASSFVICLDSNTPVTIEEKSKNGWHGDGKNRYYDKPLQFFISENGNSGFLGEHSRMDATPTVQLNNYICQKLSQQDPEAFIDSLGLNKRLEKPKVLEFDLNTTARKDIKDALEKFNKTIASHHEELFQYYGYGKNLIKQFKVSPDAYVQMMMQLAYYKLTGKVRPTYESAATRKFLKGRTETGRSVSNESKAFVETWVNPKSTVEEKVKTFQAACSQHVKYLSSAADGKGVDRHLFGLKNMLQPGEKVPEIFQDPVYSYSSSWFLSTSQIPSENFQSWGFSQVIDEGFGLAYLINKDWIHIHISCKKGNGLKSDHLKWYLTEAANEMKEILSTGLLVKAKL